MASRRDSASERLKKSIEVARSPLPPEPSLIALGREFGMIPEAPQMRIDWNDPAQHALGAHEALLLNLGELDEPIRKAFDAFGYDPLNPFHWRKLICISPMHIFRPLLRKALQRNGTMLDGASYCPTSVRSKHRVPRLPITKSASISKRDFASAMRRWKQPRYVKICNMRAIQAGMAYWRTFETGSQFRYASGLSPNPVPQAYLIQTYYAKPPSYGRGSILRALGSAERAAPSERLRAPYFPLSFLLSDIYCRSNT
jgi:hypothetical protein